MATVAVAAALGGELSGKRVGVLGCGLMGSGIAQVCAAAGYKTLVREIEPGLVDKGLGRIQKFLSDGVEKGKVTADAKQQTLANLSGTTKFGDLQGCDIIIDDVFYFASEAKALLPMQFARYYGREEEIARLEELLCTSVTRLVTLTGPGGSG